MGDRHLLRIGAVRDGTDHQVAVADQPQQVAFVHHQNDADALVAHHLSHRCHRRPHVHGRRSIGHDVAHTPGHSGFLPRSGTALSPRPDAGYPTPRSSPPDLAEPIGPDAGSLFVVKARHWVFHETPMSCLLGQRGPWDVELCVATVSGAAAIALIAVR